MSGAYPTVRLRHLAQFNPAVPEAVASDPDNEWPLLPMEQIGNFAQPTVTQQRSYKTLSTGYSYLEQTDVAYAKVTPCFENGKGLIGADLDGPVFATTEVTVLRPNPGMSQRFLAYIMQSEDFRTAAIASMTGAGGLRRVSERDMKNFRVPAPDLSVQSEIADYLDHETAEIDSLIRHLNQMKDLLSERTNTIWTGRARQVACGFSSIKVRYLVSSLVDGPFGSALTSAHYSDEGAPVVRLGNIGRIDFRLEPRAYIPSDYAMTLKSHEVRPGDVVIAGLGDATHPLGRSAVVPEEFGHGIVKADCYRARPNSRVTPEFLAWSLSSEISADSFKEESRGSTRARLNLAIVLRTAIAVPDLATQRAITDEFAQTRYQSKLAHQSLESAVRLARERRAALITATVTGQIDVTARNKPAAEQLEDDIAQGLHREN